MSNRIKKRFSERMADDRCVLVTYVTSGDPGPSATTAIMHGLVRAGADVVELGVPFSDPMADGPIIQRASERALANGMTLAGVLDIVREFRADDPHTPVVLMGYLNPIEAMGYAQFATQASAAGVDGVLVVDVPPEESEVVNAALASENIDQIFLIAPNSKDSRIGRICEYAGGFVYYVSVKGVTGSKTIDADEVSDRIKQLRTQLSLPIGVGFGIKSPESAAAVANAGDAIIVGSAIVEIAEHHAGDEAAMVTEIGSFVEQLRGAIDRARGE